ncbi:MAG: iron ABC transporter permease [Planctomycetes bacterium]|nr:iron ABC transporter permease [Planctomycetota bacterium]
MMSFWRRREESLVVGAAGLALFLAAFLPLAWTFIEAAAADPPALRRGLAALKAARPWILLGRSLTLAAAATALALLLGVPLGLLLGKTEVWGRRLALALQALPMSLPPFLLGLGWFYLFGAQGFVGSEASRRILFSELGAVLVLGLAFAPVASSLTALGLWGVDAALEEAARVVAGPVRVAVRILLPAAWPAVALAALIVFTLAFSELGVPMFLRVEVYPAAVFARLGGMDFAIAEAGFLTIPLWLVAIVLLGIERSLFRRRSFAVAGLRGRSAAPLPLGRLRFPAAACCWLATLLLLAPILSLAARAGRGGGFSAANQWLWPSLANSLILGCAAASLLAVVGAVLGHAAARRRPGEKILDGLAALAFLAPAALLGVGLTAIWNRPPTRFIYGGPAILVLGFLARYSIVAIRSFAAVLAQFSRDLEDTAAAFGAGYLRRFLGIVLPANFRGLAAAWILAFVFCWRDLETAVLFYPAGWEPLTVKIFTLEANAPEAVVAALSVAQAAATALVLALGFLVWRRKAPW